MAAPHPFSWSLSRDRVFRSCRRRYFYSYYAAPAGGRSGADRISLIAYRLKKLTSFDLVLGTAVHDRAREILQAIRSGRARPTREEVRARTRAALNAAYRDSCDMDAFLAAPHLHRMLLPAYYGRGLTIEEVERVRAKMDRCLNHLLDGPVWAELDGIGPQFVHFVDGVTSFHLDNLNVYLAPDLVYGGAADEPCVVADWKTGSAEGSDEQLALYALFAREHLRVGLSVPTYRGRVFALGKGTQSEVVLTPDDLTRARDRALESAREMQAYLSDPARNTPKAISEFPMTNRRFQCGSCEYFQLCEADLRRRNSSACSAAISHPVPRGSSQPA